MNEAGDHVESFMNPKINVCFQQMQNILAEWTLSNVLTRTCLEHPVVPVPVYSCGKTGPGIRRGQTFGWGVGLGMVAWRGRNDRMGCCEWGPMVSAGWQEFVWSVLWWLLCSMGQKCLQYLQNTCYTNRHKHILED